MFSKIKQPCRSLRVYWGVNGSHFAWVRNGVTLKGRISPVRHIVIGKGVFIGRGLFLVNEPGG